MSALIRYEAAITALAECKVDEVKEWVDKAAAMQAYGRMAQDKTLEADAIDIRLHAERRLGAMLAAQKADGGLAAGSRGQLAGKSSDGLLAVVSDDRQKNSAPKLADAGISKDLSARAQKLAAVPEAVFAAELVQLHEKNLQEGKRMIARLEVAGEREQAKTNKPAEKKKPQLTVSEGGKDKTRVAELEAENAELREQLAEMTSNMEVLMADNSSMLKSFEGNDQIMAALAQAKQFRGENVVLFRRLDDRRGERALAGSGLL